MKFTLHVSTDSKRKDVKEKCCEVLAEFLKKEGYSSVEFDPREIDTGKLVKHKVMKQPLMLQSDCTDCKLYEGFGQCYEHGNNLIENCKDYRKEE